jgi:hypothetical protein
MDVVQQYWTEHRPMSSLHKTYRSTRKTLNTAPRVLDGRTQILRFWHEYHWGVLIYSDSDTSTTDEYSKSTSTHEFSRHRLWWVLYEYSPMSTFTRAVMNYRNEMNFHLVSKTMDSVEEPKDVITCTCLAGVWHVSGLLSIIYDSQRGPSIIFRWNNENRWTLPAPFSTAVRWSLKLTVMTRTLSLLVRLSNVLSTRTKIDPWHKESPLLHLSRAYSRWWKRSLSWGCQVQNRHVEQNVSLCLAMHVMHTEP